MSTYHGLFPVKHSVLVALVVTFSVIVKLQISWGLVSSSTGHHDAAAASFTIFHASTVFKFTVSIQSKRSSAAAHRAAQETRLIATFNWSVPTGMLMLILLFSPTFNTGSRGRIARTHIKLNTRKISQHLPISCTGIRHSPAQILHFASPVQCSKKGLLTKRVRSKKSKFKRKCFCVQFQQF